MAVAHGARGDRRRRSAASVTSPLPGVPRSARRSKDAEAPLAGAGRGAHRAARSRCVPRQVRVRAVDRHRAASSRSRRCCRNDPKVIILDEPSSGIAQKETEALGPMLREVQRYTRVQHPAHRARHAADRRARRPHRRPRARRRSSPSARPTTCSTTRAWSSPTSATPPTPSSSPSPRSAASPGVRAPHHRFSPSARDSRGSQPRESAQKEKGRRRAPDEYGRLALSP